jgi:CarD family transcriptional regulator
MQFSVGDKLMHPQYGPGLIIGTEDRELVEGFHRYYVVELLMDKSTLYIPMSKMEELGVRPVMSQAKLARVLATLRKVPQRLSKDFKVRQARVREQLETARPIKLAEAVRDLTGRKERSHLTKVDRDLLDRGRELLAAEIAMATGTDIVHAHQTVDTALNGVREEAVDEPRRPPVVDGVRVFQRQTIVQRLLGRARSSE